MNFLQTLLKIPVIKGTKYPAIKQWNKTTNQQLNINIDKYDIGITTGEHNNLIVLDIDIKDNGIEEINKYINQNGNINTLTVKTPSGGLHYYFLYNSLNIDTNHLIKHSLTNKSKYRNCGIDIRTNGGYIKAPPSPNYNIINDIEPIEIPSNLILWLLEDNERIPTTKPTITHNINIPNKQIYKFNIQETEIKAILGKLTKEYYNKYNLWLLVLTICKNLNINYKIFDEWSKQDKTKYNKENNLKIWNNNKGVIDINYLIKRINTEQNINLKLIEKYKQTLTQEINLKMFKILKMNKQYLEYDNELFNFYDTIVIKSTTGTGKSTDTAKQIKAYQPTNKDKFLSLVNLIKLSEQQIKTFEDEGVKIISYQTATKTELLNDNIICCINSLYNKLNDIEDIENYIIYIDEISSFIDTLLFSDSLNTQLKQIYIKLMYIIKNCKKLIMSDAHINANVFMLIEKRIKPNQLYIINEFKKYQDIEAIRYNNENEYFNKLQDEISSNKYFLFGCDSKTTTTKYYNELINLYPDKKDKFLLITSDTTKEISNAKEQFKNKFVFYSPSITTGINFSIDEKQNAFIYIKGKSIRPELSFQQGTRTRNLNKLFYYSSANEKESIYNSLEEVKTLYKNQIETNNKVLNICANVNKDDEMEIIDNVFFNLFCDGLYNQDIQQTNKLLHFEEILKEQGFKISIIGDKQKLNTNINKKMNTQLKQEINENFDDFIDEMKTTGEITNTNNKKLFERYNILKLDVETINEYKFLLIDEFKFNSLFTFIKMFKTSQTLNELLTDKNNSNMNVKLLSDTLNKIILLRTIETNNKISPYDINFTTSKPEINITDKEFKLISKIFRITKSKPDNLNELKKFYFGMLKNIFGNLDIVKSTHSTDKDNKSVNIYYFNDNVIKLLFKLIFKMNIKHLDNKLIELFNIQIPENYINNKIEYDERFLNLYLFGKKTTIKP